MNVSCQRVHTYKSASKRKSDGVACIDVWWSGVDGEGGGCYAENNLQQLASPSSSAGKQLTSDPQSPCPPPPSTLNQEDSGT